MNVVDPHDVDALQLLETPAPPKRGVLYSPSSRGYLRSTREEGIGGELAAMHAEARGTPLFGDNEAASTEPPTLADRLAKLTRKR